MATKTLSEASKPKPQTEDQALVFECAGVEHDKPSTHFTTAKSEPVKVAASVPFKAHALFKAACSATGGSNAGRVAGTD
jgi:hypothetical protein